MGFVAFGRSKRVIRGIALATVFGLGMAVLSPVLVRAEPVESLFDQQRRKRAEADGLPTQMSHTRGSGIKATTTTSVVADGSVSPFVTPDSPSTMQAVSDKYASVVAAGGWPKVTGGRYKKGDTGAGVGEINKRLFIEGYLRQEATLGQFAQVFTSATEDALRRYQINHGLGVSGVTDAPTVGSLNTPAEVRLATIRANLPRLAEYSKDLGSRYVVVNIAAQQLETISGGKVFSLHNTIVGRPSRPTPVVMTPLATVRFNPYWNAPPSIVERDLVPRMLSRGASTVMKEMNMKIFQGAGGAEVNPDSVNWRSAIVDNYHFRQEPGGSNAMAAAKIEFNSPFGIYLHDTPEPQLFQTAERFYSSGCVRVEKVAILINWILQGQDGIDQNRIAELADPKERLDTPIKNPPQLRVASLTAWPARDGVAAFRDDVYQLDGTGFVVGQPLPVGESQSGQRFVLKPIARTPDAVEADEATGFASLFRNRWSGKEDPFSQGLAPRSTDSLINVGSAKTANRSKTTATAGVAAPRHFFNAGKLDPSYAASFADSTDVAAKPVVKKPVLAKAKSTDNSKTASADRKKALTAALKPTDTKAANTKTAAVSKPADLKAAAVKPADAKAATAKPVAPDAAKAATAAKKAPAADCKPGADGKLPDTCKAAAPAKKPVVKSQTTASAAN